jgi:hypothetical protein
MIIYQLVKIYHLNKKKSLKYESYKIKSLNNYLLFFKFNHQNSIN